MKKWLGWMMGVLALTLILLGCNSSGGGGLGPVDDASLVGKWRIETMVQHGTMRMVNTDSKIDTTIVMDTSKTYKDSTYYMEFKADKTFISNSPDVGMAKVSAAQTLTTGTWSLSGSTLTTLSKAPSNKTDTLKLEVGISASKLTAVYHIQSSDTYLKTTYTNDMTLTYTAGKM